MLRQWDITKYCNKCGFELKEKAQKKQCPNCKRNYYFNAKPCVGILLTNSKGEVLLTKRARDPFKDWWDVPGGFIEENETFEDGARRELLEETGLKMKDVKYAGSLHDDYVFEGEVVPVAVVFFKAKISGSETVKVDDDVSDYQFVDKNKIDFEKIAFDNQRLFLRSIINK